MRIPILSADKRERTMISAFGGYDKRESAGENTFRNMKNMTGSHYPAIASRDKRGTVDMGGATVFDIMSLDVYNGGELIKNALIADCENRLKAYYLEDGVFTGHDLANTSGVLSQTKKMSVVSGTKIYFFPDKVCYDLVNTQSVMRLEYSVEYPLGLKDSDWFEMLLEPCSLDGSDAAEESCYRRLRRAAYHTTDAGKKGEFNKYMAFSASLAENDTVKLSGFNDASLNGYFNIKKIAQDRSYLVFEMSASTVQTDGAVYLSREVPDMDFVVAAGNRLWGCRYGIDPGGKCVNEIYASALGDATNWHRFLGVSTDSWSASIGTAGSFTGAVCMDGNPVFFKEDAIIKIYGSYPSEFTVVETKQRGIEAGSEKSAVFVNDDLYYKTYSGIVRYDGGMPVNVDEALGVEKYKNAVSGGVDDRYFVSMENSSGERELFVYDTVKRTWHKEDSANISAFCRCGGALFFLVNSGVAGESNVYSLNASGEHPSEKDLSWMCESAPMGYGTPDRKYVSAIQIRVDTAKDAYCEIFLEYDGDGVWHSQETVRGKGGSFLIRLRPRRCDSFRIKLSGRGECRIRSITKTLEECSGHDRLG